MTTIKKISKYIDNGMELANDYGQESVLFCTGTDGDHMLVSLTNGYRNIYGVDYFWTEVEYFDPETLEFLGETEISSTDEREILEILGAIKVF